MYNDVYCLLISCADIVRQIYEKYAIKDKIIAAIYDSFKCIINDTRQLEWDKSIKGFVISNTSVKCN